jgi:hypothetical protein
MRRKGLDYDLTPALAPPGAACELGQKLKGALGGTEIRKV